MVAPLYTRYVPPRPYSKSTAKSTTQSTPKDEEPSKKRKRETKDRHSKKRSKAEENDSLESVDKATTPAAANGTVTDQKEAENGHKSKKRTKPQEDGGVAEVDSEHHGHRQDSKNNPKEDFHPDEGYEKNNGAVKEKHHKKREKKLRNSERESHENASTEDGSVDDRHRSVLAKYEKSMKHSKERPKSPTPEAQDVDEANELRDIVPIPVPDEPKDEMTAPDFSSLPSWQIKPIIASSDNRIRFQDLKVDSKLVEALSRKGFDRALPIQSTVLPLLLPIPGQHAGDLCVSAMTGSGKTLAYTLPIVQSLKARAITKLGAVIVVPTRELVAQVRDVVETCASGSSLKIGTAVGNHNFSKEQDSLVEKGWRYDPKTVAKRRAELSTLEERYELDISTDALDEFAINGDEEDEDALPGHVREYYSQVDILVCTPGRLVEHIKSTNGFSLKYLKWLVIDEADRLLGESFQEWSSVLLAAMHVSRKDRLPQDLINHPIFTHYALNIEPERVRKVLLSATMTTDMDKLIPLDLWNPKLVVLDKHEREEANIGKDSVNRGLQLPLALEEFGIPVKDASQKPLYLLHLLRDIMPLHDPLHKTRHAQTHTNAAKENTFSDGTESDSSISEDTSSASSSDDNDDSKSDASDWDADLESLSEDPYVSTPAQPKLTTGSQSALIFTSSNQATSRLSALLSYLDPTLSSMISTVTKSSSVSGRSLSSSVKSGHIRLLIATDRAARGLDLPDLGNVVNYDIPRSMSSYIHRIGRTARANKGGRAWTLVEDREGAWFWKDLARGTEIDRGNKTVQRINVDASVFSDEMTERYTEALKQLQDDVRA